MDCLSPNSLKEQRKCFQLPLNSSEERGNCLELPPDTSEEQGKCVELPPESLEEVRNWLELPPDVMSLIFLKLGAIEILFGAQAVCSTWRKLSKEPQLWRSVHIWKRPESFFGDVYMMKKMAREAVDRSCGQLVEFYVEHFATDELLDYIASRSSQLKCIRLVSCSDVSNDGLIEITQKLPILEELELCHCEFATEVLEVVGHLCPQLKLFRLNRTPCRQSRSEGDDKALTIAKSMAQLRHLNLFGNMLTDTGLRAILDGCPHLESLDLRRCLNLKLEGDLLKRCVDGIRNLRLPEDSTDDYEFDIDGDGHESDNEYEFGAHINEHEFYFDREQYYEWRQDESESDQESDHYEWRSG